MSDIGISWLDRYSVDRHLFPWYNFLKERKIEKSNTDQTDQLVRDRNFITFQGVIMKRFVYESLTQHFQCKF